MPFDVTVPEVSPDVIEGRLTNNESLSTSVSFASTAKVVAPSSSVMVPVSAFATGLSLTSVIVTVTDAESAPSLLSDAK